MLDDCHSSSPHLVAAALLITWCHSLAVLSQLLGCWCAASCTPKSQEMWWMQISASNQDPIPCCCTRIRGDLVISYRVSNLFSFHLFYQLFQWQIKTKKLTLRSFILTAGGIPVGRCQHVYWRWGYRQLWRDELGTRSDRGLVTQWDTFQWLILLRLLFHI